MNRNEDIHIPDMPGYIPLKEAAKMLNLSVSRVYDFVEEGRLSAVRAAHVIMIPIEEVKNFKPKLSGRPRTSVPKWRISPDENTLIRMSIRVSVKTGKQKQLMARFEDVRRSDAYNFPGTLIRYIAGKEIDPQEVEIVFIWRGSMMPDEAERERELEAFRQIFAGVLDWETARYEHDVVYMHT